MLANTKRFNVQQYYISIIGTLPFGVVQIFHNVLLRSFQLDILILLRFSDYYRMFGGPDGIKTS